MLKIAAIACHETEDIELIVPVDIWRKAGMRVDIISLDKKNSIVLQSGTKFSCNGIIEKSNLSQYNAIYLPGGIGSKRYFSDDWTPKNIDVVHKLHKTLEDFTKNDKKYILAMDEAPKILADLKLLNQKSKLTCSDCIKQTMQCYYVNDNVVVCKNLITSKCLGDVFDFSFAVVDELLDKKKAATLKGQLFTSK